MPGVVGIGAPLVVGAVALDAFPLVEGTELPFCDDAIAVVGNLLFSPRDSSCLCRARCRWNRFVLFVVTFDHVGWFVGDLFSK